MQKLGRTKSRPAHLITISLLSSLMSLACSSFLFTLLLNPPCPSIFPYLTSTLPYLLLVFPLQLSPFHFLPPSLIISPCFIPLPHYSHIVPFYPLFSPPLLSFLSSLSYSFSFPPCIASLPVIYLSPLSSTLIYLIQFFPFSRLSSLLFPNPSSCFISFLSLFLFVLNPYSFLPFPPVLSLGSSLVFSFPLLPLLFYISVLVSTPSILLLYFYLLFPLSCFSLSCLPSLSSSPLFQLM